MAKAFLNWSGLRGAPQATLTVRDPGPIDLERLPRCVKCDRPCLLRNPATRKAEHKVCAEAVIDQVAYGTTPDERLTAA